MVEVGAAAAAISCGRPLRQRLLDLRLEFRLDEAGRSSSPTAAIGISIFSCGRASNALTMACALSGAGRIQVGGAGLKVDELQIRTAAEQRSQQCERRRDRLFEDVDEDLPDDRSQAEFRIVERAGDRKIQIDDAVAILEQRDRQLDRQRYRVLALGLVAEFELIDDDVMLRIELAAVDLVVQLGGQLALGDVVARELSRNRD